MLANKLRFIGFAFRDVGSRFAGLALRVLLTTFHYMT